MSLPHITPHPRLAGNTVRGVPVFFCAAVILVTSIGLAKELQQAPEKIEEINKEFHFLGEDGVLLIHEEDGRLKGQVNLFAGEEESDTILTYQITIGERSGNHVVIKTVKVHEKYFRFSGTVERGAGAKEREPDYLRLVGELQIVQVNGMTGKETTQTKQVVLKSLGAGESDKE